MRGSRPRSPGLLEPGDALALVTAAAFDADAQAPGQVLVRPRHHAPLGRDRHVEHVRGGRIAGRLDLDPVPAASGRAGPSGRARPPRARRRCTGSPRRTRRRRGGRRPRWHAAGRAPGRRRRRRSPGRRRSRAPRPTTRPAGSRCPSCAPRRRSRRRATSSPHEALGARPQDERAPVLPQERARPGRARCRATAAARRRRRAGRRAATPPGGPRAGARPRPRTRCRSARRARRPPARRGSPGASRPGCWRRRPAPTPGRRRRARSRPARRAT